jgi:hypothetical protein
MLAVHENRVSTLAQRAGLRLIRSGTSADADTDDALYQLVEATTMTPLWPGRGGELGELEDWLHCPWE